MRTTEPTTANCTMTCRLRSHAITNEGDFVPAGTPVKVMGWTGNDPNGSGAGSDATVEVRAWGYMYADTFDYESGRAAVGRGLYLSVDPSNLVFDSIVEDME